MRRLILLSAVDSDAALREFMKGPDFRLVKKVAVVTDLPNAPVHNLLLFERRNISHAEAAELQLKMLTLNHDINVPLKELGIN